MKKFLSRYLKDMAYTNRLKSLAPISRKDSKALIKRVRFLEEVANDLGVTISAIDIFFHYIYKNYTPEVAINKTLSATMVNFENLGQLAKGGISAKTAGERLLASCG